MPRLCLSFLVSLGIATQASAVSIDWVLVGDPGNSADTEVMTCCFDSVGTSGYGSVPYAYQISKYEVTNAQYAEFLNAVAAAGQADPNALYNTSMGSGFGGITRTVVGPDYSYAAIALRQDMPVNYVSFYDSLRFANWLHNGTPTGAQTAGTTEGGSYTFSGPMTVGARNSNATIFLTSENEWYKAAYHDALNTCVGDYCNYPAGFDTATTCATPTATANRANCDNDVGDLTNKGSYTGSASPYGTFDQGGNVFEWNEAIISGSGRGIRGGSFDNVSAFYLAASVRFTTVPTNEVSALGFRVAMIPEPSTGLLVIAGLLGLAGWRRGRA